MLEFTEDNTGPALPMLHKWLSENYALRVFLAVGNSKNFVTFMGSRLDGVVGPLASQLPESWYQEFVVSSCIAILTA